MDLRILAWDASSLAWQIGRNPRSVSCRPRFISEGSMLGGYAADDWVGLHFVGSKLHQIVSTKPNANAFEVSRNSAGPHEKVISPVLL